VSGGADGTVRLWKWRSRQGDVLEIGAPVEQVGFLDGQLWARAIGEQIIFFDRAFQPAVYLMPALDGALAFTKDGWYSGEGRLRQSIRLFRGAAEPVPTAEVERRFSPERVLAAIERH
jgi:hypothetical protein